MAAKNFGRVNVSITASTGGLTAGLANASRQLGGFSSQTRGIGGQLTSMAAGFVGAGRSATVASVGVKALSVAVKSLLGPLLIITSLVEIFAKFGRSARELDEAGKTARRLGMSMTSFQNLGQVADEAGVSMGQMSTLLTFMTRNLGNLSNGSAAAEKSFGRLNLSLETLRGLSPEQQFELISQRIMELPSAAQRTAAAVSMFGRQGAMAMGLIADASSGAVSEVSRLREQLGVNLTDTQVKGIEMMNDAVGRLSILFDGFINQFLAKLAPAITTVANLLVQFFAQSGEGFSIATMLADAFAFSLRRIVGRVTQIYGAFQILSSFIAGIGAGLIRTFELIAGGLQSILSKMAAAAERLPGFDIGLASSLRSAENAVSAASGAAGREGDIWAQAAVDSFGNGIRNLTDPFAAFDAEFDRITTQMQDAGAAGGQAFGDAAGASVATAVRASSEALKAIVVGSSSGEEFRNSILRGADPRLAGDAAQETADNTGEMVDQLDELNGNLAGAGGLALASISV